MVQSVFRIDSEVSEILQQTCDARFLLGRAGVARRADSRVSRLCRCAELERSAQKSERQVGLGATQ